MSNFPLYSSLCNELPNKDLTSVQKADFVKKVDAMDQDGHELIYALIKTFYIDKENNSPFILPYGGKVVKNEMSYDMDNIPVELRQLLYKFAKIHTKKMKEDSKMEKNRNLK